MHATSREQPVGMQWTTHVELERASLKCVFLLYFLKWIKAVFPKKMDESVIDEEHDCHVGDDDLHAVLLKDDPSFRIAPDVDEVSLTNSSFELRMGFPQLNWSPSFLQRFATVLLLNSL